MTYNDYFSKYKDEEPEVLQERLDELERLIEENPDIEKEAFAERDVLKALLANLPKKQERSRRFRYIEGTDPVVPTFGDNVLATAEYRSAFFKTLLGRNLNASEQAAYRAGIKQAEKRASAFTATSDAMAIIPLQTLDEAITKARAKNGLLANCRAFHVPPLASFSVSTSETGAIWHVLGTRINSDKITSKSVVFKDYRVVQFFNLSGRARDMPISSLESYLTDEFRICIFGAINDALVNGTGEGEPKGLLNAITWDTTNSVTVSTGTKFSYKDTAKTVAKLKRGYTRKAAWAMNNATLYGQFYGVVDEQKRPIFVQDPTRQSIGKILGFGIIIDDHIPTGTAILGNFSNYLGYNLPEDILVEVSQGSFTRRGMIDIRIMAIADCAVIAPEAFVKLSVGIPT